jgi:hypothetical protein
MQTGGAEVAEVVDGVPKAYHKLTGVTNLDAISCPGQDLPCEATGFARSGDVVVEISSSGNPGRVMSVPALFDAIWCSTAQTCEAVSSQGKTASVLTIKAGVPGTVHTVTVTTSSGAIDQAAISCSLPSSCHVGITFSTGTAFHGLVFPVTAGVPGAVTEESTTYGISGISCPAAGQCTVVGSSVAGTAMVADLSGAKLGAVHVVDKATELNAISCPEAGTCTAVGSTNGPKDTTGRSIVVPVSGGLPGVGTIVSAAVDLTSVATAGGSFYEAIGPTTFGLNSGKDIVTSN